MVVEVTVAAVDHLLVEPVKAPRVEVQLVDFPDLPRTLRHRLSVELALVEVDLPAGRPGAMEEVDSVGELLEEVMAVMVTAIRLTMADRAVLREVSRMPEQVASLVLVPVQLVVVAAVVTLVVLDHREAVVTLAGLDHRLALDLDRDPSVDKVVTAEVTLKK